MNKRRILGVALAMGAAFALTACGSATPSDPAPSQTPPTQTQALTYPEGNLNLYAGALMRRLTFDGYDHKTGDWRNIDLAEYYDPDGKKGHRALLVIVSAQWCVPCQEEAKHLPELFNYYEPQGVRFLQLMVQNVKGDPATQTTVDEWKTKFGINFDIAMDPKESSLPRSSGVPRNYLIDTRTMKIIKADAGTIANEYVQGINDLVKKNGG